ncbi:efflux transporter periplasmic adaptor subunit [Arachidicoccus ginsenosidimutans]|uniref:efflux RND transporter periplasmic adaptor subunit n=1 Tax=Arachidicoccus sp. BS20 TaxID=1850526 RepID=UPI0007F06FCB|nr:efflux RND transporter periplasmic adaptor subunit [Arachidicoccus sp. BS20]ANI90696.1 efflux transporter periplasmic adaptor subunit [Arachidicoccus sp. BS20]
MKSINKIYVPVFAVMLAGTALQSCGNAKSEKASDATTDSSSSAVTVNAFKLTQGKLSNSLTMPGELIAFQNVDIYAKVSSFVKKLYVDVGSQVSQGQLLAVMEAPEINAQLDAANSRVEAQKAIYLSDKATYDRLLETSKTPGTVSPNELEIADAKQKSDYAQYQSALAAVKEVSDNRNYLEIRAPFSGVITARNVSAGAFVATAGAGAALPIFTLQEQKKLRLVVDVPQSSAGTLHLNDKVSFTVKSLPGETFNAKVSRLAGALDSRLRSQHIEADVENDDKILLPGMVAEVSMPLSNKTNKTSFVIPKTALLNSTLGIYVIKVENGKTVWIPVATGGENDSAVAVFGNGLNENDTLVKNVTEEVRNGAELKGKLSVQ